MSVLQELGRLSSAEDFFNYLDLPFEPTVVQVSRLHILRRMGQYLKGSEIDGAFEGLDDAKIKALCRDASRTGLSGFRRLLADPGAPVQGAPGGGGANKPEPASNFVSLDSSKIV